MLRRLVPPLLLLMGTIGWPAAPSYAKKSGLTPAKVKRINKTRKSYEACRKDAIAKLKSGTYSEKKFEIALTTCKENFPGADLYVTCKRAAIRAAKAKNIDEDQAIEQCKRYLLATQFDPQERIPFFVEAGQMYFAGIGMNHSVPGSTLGPPNFDCEKLKSVARNPEKAQYFLFGNHPRTFAALADVKGEALMKTLKMTRPAKNGVDVDGFGRVYGDPRTKSGVVFFPSSSCDFDAEVGDLFAGLSAYYLLDTSGSAVTPYFGIAYYKAEQTSVTSAKLTQALIHTLGPNFKAYPKDEGTTFIAAASVAETDDEQDPKNLCRQPRQHRFVGVVEGRKDDPTKPEYLILANIKALCDFGDRLAKRLVE